MPGINALAEWVPISDGLKDIDVRTVATHPKDESIIYAASEKEVYQTINGGQIWKRVFSVQGNHRVNFIFVDAAETSEIYVATDRGIRKSADGKRWVSFFSRVGDRANEVFCLAPNSESAGKFWAGTGDGLVLLDGKSGRAEGPTALHGMNVYSILPKSSSGPSETIAVTDRGIFRNSGIEKETAVWEKVYGHPEGPPRETTEEALEQFGVEELALGPVFARAAYWRAEDRCLVAGNDGLLLSRGNGSDWQKAEGQSFGKEKVNAVAVSARTFYAATDQGIFQWDEKKRDYRKLTGGLQSEKVQALGYSDRGDCLIAGTKRGVFKWAHPEFDGTAGAENKERSPGARDFLERFKGEPSIREVQAAAIQFAEVHPQKIEQWRAAASRKAWLPTLSVGADLDKDRNVDLDRGGTGDPDRFIIGPDEKSTGFSVSLNWDLGDLIWNGDQTSIDTRSRLMVELREDVLNEVTHLYYERRRLETEMALSPPRDLPVEVEKELRLEELTAGIDGLTGGYFSKKLAERHHLD
jgi:hypothetical protein